MSDAGLVAAARGRATNVRWVVLAALGLLSLIAYVERLNLSVAGAGIKADYGLDDRQLGWIFTAFTLSYAAFQIPGGIFGEVWGLRRTLALSCLLWAFITIASGLWPGVLPSTASVIAGLIVLRFLMGAAQAPFFPILAGTIANWFPIGRWAFPNALTTACLAVGSFLTSYGVAFLMDRYGWRATFYVTGPLAFAGALVWWVAARDKPREHPAVNAAEIELIEHGRAKRGHSSFPSTAQAPADSQGGNEECPHFAVARRRAWLDLLRNRETLLLALSYLSMNYVFYIFFSWFFISLTEERHFPGLHGGFYAGLPWFVAAFGASIGGALCDRLCRRIGPRWGCRAPAMTGLIIAAALLYFGAVASDPLVAIALLSLCFGFIEVTEGPFWAAQTYVARDHTPAATGVLNTGGNLGGVICSPVIPILVHELGWIPALASGSVVALFGAVLWLFIRVDRPLEADIAPAPRAAAATIRVSGTAP